MAQANNTTTKSSSSGSKNGGVFTKDLVGMMYGFGDAKRPYKESVEVVDKLVIQYIETLCRDALAANNLRESRKLDTECFMFAIQKQPAKYKRVKELLEMRTKLRDVRRIDHGGEDSTQ